VRVSELASRKISYTRGAGSRWTLSLKGVIDRLADFAMAYKTRTTAPNCGWGAAA
jgi:hypothetical protein